jgi:hypothetical protein
MDKNDLSKWLQKSCGESVIEKGPADVSATLGRYYLERLMRDNQRLMLDNERLRIEIAELREAPSKGYISDLKDFIENMGSSVFLGLAVPGYPFWCRYRHQRWPYSTNQLELRKYVFRIYFRSKHKPQDPRLGMRFIQAFSSWEFFKSFTGRSGKSSPL